MVKPKEKTVTRYFATYKSTQKWQGSYSTFTTDFNRVPPKTIKGEHGIVYKMVGKPKKKKVVEKQSRWWF
jgi:hypothetical protein